MISSKLKLYRHGAYWVPITCDNEKLFLASNNIHARDSEIAFDDIPHLYYVRGQEGYISVTTVIHEFFEEFDADKIATRMVNRLDFLTSAKYTQYHQYCFNEDKTLKTKDMIKDQIIDSWERNRDECARLGTKLHRNIELFYNSEPVNDTSVEFQHHFKRFHAMITKKRGWVPYRTEFMIFDEESHICGSIDMIYFCPSQKTYHMVDWKRSKAINKHGFHLGKGPCAGIQDCNFEHYSLQLNLYQMIIEKHYNIKITDRSIVVMHPNNNDFLEYAIPDRQSMVDAIIQARMCLGQRKLIKLVDDEVHNTPTSDASIYYLNVNHMKTCIAQQLGVDLKQEAQDTTRVVIRIERRDV
jgi:hypothetical protein